MDGLIPFLFHAMKKRRTQHSYRSLSENSTRSYHLLRGGESVEGSSHRRTRSEFLPPSVDFLEQRSSGLEYFSHTKSFSKVCKSSPNVVNGLRQMGPISTTNLKK
ncbi:unnamed protein product [Fraxinus pennsylvanica]|uniref:Uncharacterized protein n=1 Tax=Fraxinus pennsylvanica TaxID=56036 RepID=A0AAD1ZG27_9LAMI|nr:unnamed protein product [Fraxinus pennsylvanica]